MIGLATHSHLHCGISSCHLVFFIVLMINNVYRSETHVYKNTIKGIKKPYLIKSYYFIILPHIYDFKSIILFMLQTNLGTLIVCCP